MLEGTAPHPMAAQLAALLCESDLDELREIVRRWVQSAPTQALRAQQQEMGERLIEIKLSLAELPRQPTRPELEIQLTLMLQLAQSAPARPSR
jgi:hypothetical protein